MFIFFIISVDIFSEITVAYTIFEFKATTMKVEQYINEVFIESEYTIQWSIVLFMFSLSRLLLYEKMYDNQKPSTEFSFSISFLLCERVLWIFYNFCCNLLLCSQNLFQNVKCISSRCFLQVNFKFNQCMLLLLIFPHSQPTEKIDYHLEELNSTKLTKK